MSTGSAGAPSTSSRARCSPRRRGANRAVDASTSSSVHHRSSWTYSALRRSHPICGSGREGVGAHEVDLVGLAVPFAVQHRDHMEPAPHVRADVGADEAELLGELAPQRVDRVLVAVRCRPPAAPTRRPSGSRSGRAARGRPDRAEPRARARRIRSSEPVPGSTPRSVSVCDRTAHSSGVSRRPSLKPRYIS